MKTTSKLVFILLLTACTTSLIAQYSVFSSSMYTRFTQIILPTDPTSLQSSDFDKVENAKISIKHEYDQSSGKPSVIWGETEVYIYELAYDDGLSSKMRIKKEDFSKEEADELVKDYGFKIGQLPACLRRGLKYVNILKGDDVEMAVRADKSITIFIGKWSKIHARGNRVASVLMTVTAKVALEQFYDNDEWKASKEKDVKPISSYVRYGEANDIAENFLAYVSVSFRKRRLQYEDVKKINENIPNRLKLMKVLDGDMYPMKAINDFNPNSYYRLKTQCSGEKLSLSYSEGDLGGVKMEWNKDESEQLWQITPLGEGKYRLTSVVQGDKKSLAMVGKNVKNEVTLKENINDGTDVWTIGYSNNDFFYMTSMYNGEERSFGYSAKRRSLSISGDMNSSGPRWEIIEVKSGKGNNNSNEPKVTSTTSTINSPKPKSKIEPKAKVVQKPKVTLNEKDEKSKNTETTSKRTSKNPYHAKDAVLFSAQKYYRLTSSFLGEEKSLDIVNDAEKNKLMMAKSGNYSGQMWKIEAVPYSKGYYHLTTSFLGKEKSLDIVNDSEKNKLMMAKTGRTSGQMWKIEPIEGREGYYRLTTMFTGKEKSLDIVNDSEKNKLMMAKTGNYSGQIWKITEIK